MKKIENIVKNLLINFPKTRDDDFYLIGGVYVELLPSVKHLGFTEVIKNHSLYGLPSFESITRARRKIQAENEDLVSDKAKKLRQKEEQEYVGYYGGR